MKSNAAKKYWMRLRMRVCRRRRRNLEGTGKKTSDAIVIFHWDSRMMCAPMQAPEPWKKSHARIVRCGPLNPVLTSTLILPRKVSNQIILLS